ncbi:universal stress protein [Variovorax sp. JS1663]|uniref:universal stress protein n=1 Tax=Variovorax sp. JS1663 TaxID=1851577 RepID=UPI000B349531|nr:universal stress protein [Variovorax sp. JS1663]OUL98677.1 hypothetical protein A8M77_30160 [Variovorax sp. JS1663]
MNFKAILVLTDFSAAASAALDRATLLAIEHRATLTLMHAAEPGDTAPSNAAVRLDQTARQLAQRTGLEVFARYASGDALAAIAAESDRVDLLVVPHRRARGLAAFLHGPPALRIARVCRCPMLVVKAAARERYRRILVTVDFKAFSQSLVALACTIDRLSEIELFHAISLRDDARLRAAEASYQAVLAYRRRVRQVAQQRMFALSDSFQARRNRMLMAIGQGDPARQALVQQEYAGADLVVVGKRRRPAWADALFGSVAQRLLAWAGCDVVVLPHDPRPSTRSAARDRLHRALRGGRAALLPGSRRGA